VKGVLVGVREVSAGRAEVIPIGSTQGAGSAELHRRKWGGGEA
jgi:hypothetical protein